METEAARGNSGQEEGLDVQHDQGVRFIITFGYDPWAHHPVVCGVKMDIITIYGLVFFAYFLDILSGYTLGG